MQPIYDKIDDEFNTRIEEKLEPWREEQGFPEKFNEGWQKFITEYNEKNLDSRYTFIDGDRLDQINYKLATEYDYDERNHAEKKYILLIFCFKPVRASDLYSSMRRNDTCRT